MGQIFRTFSVAMIIAACMVASFLGGIYIIDPELFWSIVDEIIGFFDRPTKYVSDGVTAWQTLKILKAAERW